MVNEIMQERIQEELRLVEDTHGVRILLAVESGSRAWGMASADSDYDVRFVYVRPEREYLRLRPLADTIDWCLDEVLDINGWDLTKFLKLVHGSNPTAFEWLASPVVYRENPAFAVVRESSKACFSPKASAFHYLGLAGGHNRTRLYENVVSAKKCLYVVRALLAARWCLEERTPAPMLVADLIAAKLPGTMQARVDELLAAKAAGDEHLMVPQMPDLVAWAEAESTELYTRATQEQAPERTSWGPLDEAFLSVLGIGARSTRTAPAGSI